MNVRTLLAVRQMGSTSRRDHGPPMRAEVTARQGPIVAKAMMDKRHALPLLTIFMVLTWSTD